MGSWHMGLMSYLRSRLGVDDQCRVLIFVAAPSLEISALGPMCTVLCRGCRLSSLFVPILQMRKLVLEPRDHYLGLYINLPGVVT